MRGAKLATTTHITQPFPSHPHRTGTDKDQTAETDITAVETGTETEAVPEGEAIQEVGEIADLKEKIRNVKLCVGNATKKGIINQNADRI